MERSVGNTGVANRVRRDDRKGNSKAKSRGYFRKMKWERKPTDRNNGTE